MPLIHNDAEGFLWGQNIDICMVLIPYKSYYEDMCTILQGWMNQNDAKCTQLLVLHCSDEASAGGQTPLIVASQDKKSPQQIYLLL